MKKSYANLPLHGGKAPAWLFSRMRLLAREIAIAIVSEYNSKELLNRLSDPFWFQAFGCVLGFDWHSSGVTTTTLGALKDGTKEIDKDLGVFIAGGKGRTSRGTPQEIEKIIDKNSLSLEAEKLKYASRMSAKVDSNALQDGFSIYHHNLLFTKDGSWSVIQQGMKETSRMARRYHWLSENLKDFVCEPHLAVCCDKKTNVLNLVAEEGKENRSASCFVAGEKPEKIIKDLNKLKELTLPERHHILLSDINPERLKTIFLKTYLAQPKNFEELLGITGVGAKTMRSLSLISELVYNAPASIKDPVRFSFAHGGKDSFPYPVDRDTYDLSIEILNKAINKAGIDHTEKIKAFKRLGKYNREN
ncbi:MAG: DUF763 domain-containing protein [Armatimonadota bacterium]